MRKLDTIQKVEKLNEVFAVDEKGPGNANHQYIITREETDKDGNTNQVTIANVNFQKGPRNEENSQAGVLDVDLLEIVRDRLKGFQSGEFACDLNEKVLYHVEKALEALNERVIDRHNRKVLGHNVK